MNRKAVILLLVFVMGIAVTMFFSSPFDQDRVKTDVRIYVASSLEPAVKARVDELRDQLPADPVVTSAGSQTVARQVANGMETGIVFLANTRWMDYLEERGLIIPGTHRVFLSNRLVLVGPPEKSTVKSIRDLRNHKIKLGLGNVTSVPAGIYARKTLESMGLWKDRKFTTVMFPNVRSVLSAVASGSLDAGIVYQTDLQREQSVQKIGTFPPQHVPSISYPGALVRGASDAAREWYSALTEPRSYSTYRRFGFTIAKP